MADGAATPAKGFRWDDPLDLDGRLTDDERMIQEAARSYAREKLLPRVVAAFRDEKLLTVGAGENVVRLLPPLIVSEAEIEDGIARVERACAKLTQAQMRQGAAS